MYVGNGNGSIVRFLQQLCVLFNKIVNNNTAVSNIMCIKNYAVHILTLLKSIPQIQTHKMVIHTLLN